MKYIDSDLLRKEIERLRGQNKELLQQAPSIGREFLFGISGAYSDVLKIIDSLQQEQPVVMNIPSAGSGAMGTTPPKFKLDVKQDLPVGLEKEIQEYLEKLGGGHGGFVDDLIDDDLIDFALHFYEFGRARKEE